MATNKKIVAVALDGSFGASGVMVVCGKCWAHAPNAESWGDAGATVVEQTAADCEANAYAVRGDFGCDVCGAVLATVPVRDLVVVSVPGRLEDDSDTTWFVFDREGWASVAGPFEQYDDARDALRRMR